MAAAGRELDAWLDATVDTVLATAALAVVWYPAVWLGNWLVGRPLVSGTVGWIVLVLALGSAYPFVAGDWSLGDLGEFVFVLLAAALAWGVVGLLGFVAFGVEMAGSNRLPQVWLWAFAYATAYGVVSRTQVFEG